MISAKALPVSLAIWAILLYGGIPTRIAKIFYATQDARMMSLGSAFEDSSETAAPPTHKTTTPAVVPDNTHDGGACRDQGLVLVTGATGRVGRLATQELLEQGFCVRVYTPDVRQARDQLLLLTGDNDDDDDDNPLEFVPGLLGEDDFGSAFEPRASSGYTPVTHVLYAATAGNNNNNNNNNNKNTVEAIHHRGVAECAKAAAAANAKSMVVMSAAWVSKPYSLGSILFNSMYDNVPSAKFLQGENALRDVAHDSEACQAKGDAGSETCQGLPLSYVILRSGALAADGDAQEGGGFHLSQTDSFRFQESGPKLTHAQLAHAAVEALKVQGKYTVEVSGSGSGNGKPATSSYETLSQDDDENFNRYYSTNRTTSADYIEEMHAKAVADFYNVVFSLLVGTVLLVILLGVTRGLALSMTLYLLTTILWMTFLSNLTLVEAVPSSRSSSSVRGFRSITQQPHQLDVVTLDDAHVRALQGGWLPPVMDDDAEAENKANEKDDKNKNKNDDKEDNGDDDDAEVEDDDKNDEDDDNENGDDENDKNDKNDENEVNEEGAFDNALEEIIDAASTNAPTEAATLGDDASEELLGTDAGNETINPTEEVFNLSPLGGAVSAAEDVDDPAKITAPPSSVVLAEETVPENSNGGAQLHYVTLEPFYLKVTSSGESFEEGFMEFLVDYLEFYMSTGFEAFESISYGVSTFSQTSAIPPTVARNEETPLALITNSTVHVHLLTAIFDGSPGAPDAVILDYMEMMLENPVMLQEYIDSQPELEATIYGVELEIEEDVRLTDGQESQAQAQVETDDSGGTNVGLIAGVTVGCFVAVVWVVYLYGIQRRHDSQYHS